MPSNKIISGMVLKKRKEQESNPWSMTGYFTVKSILALVNILIFVFGLIIIGVGADLIKVLHFGLPHELSIAVIVLGVFISIVGGVGIYGVFSENGMYLRTYIILIFIAFALKIITLILILTKSSQINSYFDGIFKSKSTGDIARAEYIQNTFQCCGTSNCKYSEPCGPKLQSAYMKLALPIGIVAGIEACIIIICLLYISYLVKKSTISKSEIKEAWKQNNNSIQKDYSKLNYA